MSGIPVVGVGQTPTPVPDATAAPLPVPVAPLPPPPVLTVDQMVDRVVRALNLEAHRAALKPVMVAYCTYVGGPDFPVQAMDRASALDELDLNYGWKPENLQAADTEIMEALAAALQELAGKFNTATDSNLSGDDIFTGFAKRYQDELVEQQASKDLADTILDMIRAICGQLAMTNPDPALQASSAPAPASHQFFAQFGSRASAIAHMAVGAFIATEDKEPGKVTTPPPSWNTLPVLTADDRDVRRVKSVYVRVTTTKDLSTVLPALNNLNLGPTELLALMTQVAQKARDQLSLRQQILDNVAGDNRMYAAAIEAVRNLQGIVRAVDDYFFPESEPVARPMRSGR